MKTRETIRPEDTLADLAVTLPGASRVFHRHELDFCCHGRISLEAACAERDLDPAALAREIEREAREDAGFERWDERPLEELIDHILLRFHAPLREELPRLLAMARRVEEVHGKKPSSPKGLGDLFEGMACELESHMQKEEQVLFPLVRAGQGRMARMPIQVMEAEHVDVGKDLARIREITADFTAPEEACGTWRALYLGLEELELELMRHIHLENNVLFPRALRG
jgi:regulator of cell morphogenesis and NO signaling